MCAKRTVPKFIDPVFAKTSPKRLFLMTENESFWLVFAKTGSINSGTESFEKKFVIHGTWNLSNIFPIFIFKNMFAKTLC